MLEKFLAEPLGAEPRVTDRESRTRPEVGQRLFPFPRALIVGPALWNAVGAEGWQVRRTNNKKRVPHPSADSLCRRFLTFEYETNGPDSNLD